MGRSQRAFRPGFVQFDRLNPPLDMSLFRTSLASKAVPLLQTYVPMQGALEAAALDYRILESAQFCYLVYWRIVLTFLARGIASIYGVPTSLFLA
jgi:hypothetical protein